MPSPYDLGRQNALSSLGLEKRAFWPELLSSGFRDVGRTRQTMPWLGVMRKYSPTDIQAKEDWFRAVGKKYFKDPIYGSLSPIVDKLPEGRIKNMTQKTVEAISEDPVLTLLPGAPITLPAKKMIEKAIKKKYPPKQ